MKAETKKLRSKALVGSGSESKSNGWNAIRSLFKHNPIRHSWWEMTIMRFGVAWVVYMALQFLPLNEVTQPVPHGLAAWGIDFTWLSNPEIVKKWVTCCYISLLFYVLGVWPALTLPAPLIIIVSQGILSNSQGAIHHTSQVIGVSLLAGWLASVYALATSKKKPLPYGFSPQQLGMDWMRQMLIAGYVVSALMKIIHSDGNWLENTPYFGLQVEKSTGMAYYSFLKAPDNAAWLGQYFIDHPLIAKISIGMGLPLELFAFLALLNRRMALFFGLALYCFHLIISQAMGLGFLYNRMLLLFLFINPAWWVVFLAARVFGKKLR